MVFLSLTEDSAVCLFHGIELNRKTYHLGPINTLLVPGRLTAKAHQKKKNTHRIPIKGKAILSHLSVPSDSFTRGQPLLNLVGCIPVDRLFFCFFGQQNGVCGVDDTPSRAAEIPRGLPCESGNATQVQLYDVTKSVAITQVNR